jgi:uncharacterized protein (DUF1501 family)
MLKKTSDHPSRRSLLDFGAKAAAAASLSGLLAPVSRAAGPERACVCIYLLGGNDSNNMIVPLDAEAYQAYARGRGSLALPHQSLHPIKAPTTSANYGFHPALAGLQDLYNRGVLAVVANVGREDRPLSKGRFNVNELPSDLFLHTGASQVRYLPQGRLAIAWDPDASSTPMMPNLTVNMGSSLSYRLARITDELSGRNSRTTFTLTLSGFDTHSDELRRQAALFADLNDGLVTFYERLQHIGLADRVTVFTSTEFNRTLAPNKNGGAEHAWGGHNLVVGGSVRGGDVYGRFPSLELGGADDLGSNGVWIPSISDQQYSATIARWYGISDLSASFPDLDNFSQQDVEFLAS